MYMYIYIYIYVCVCIYVYTCMHIHATDMYVCNYVVAMISRLLKVIGLFCRISSLLLGSFDMTYVHTN